MIPSRSQTAGGGGRRAVGATSRSNGRIRPYLPPACFLVLAFAFVTAAERADGAGASSPGSESLLSAQHDDANWILPAKTYSGNRYTSLSQIDKTNLGSLGMAWRTDIADDGDCVQAAGDGQQSFPTTDLPGLQQVELGGATCPVK